MSQPLSCAMRRLPNLGMVLLPLALLAGCAASPTPFDRTASVQDAAVPVGRAEQRFSLSMTPSGGLQQSEMAGLPAFLALWRDEGWGPLVIEASPSLSLAARDRLHADLAERARRTGADGTRIILEPFRPNARLEALEDTTPAQGQGTPTRLSPGRAVGPANGVVWLRFDRAVALLPDCGPDRFSYGQSTNASAPSFGCATRRNLGALVANPADLVEPSLDGSVNASRGASRGAAAIANHRRGAAPAADGASAAAGAPSGAGFQP
jgi:type IV pilus biogenesis protein CpaD/CtpE